MYKVLLVDDETINYQLFEKLVDWQEKGFVIAGTAADGQEAIRKYEEIVPDLIFMDIQLPFMDGLECVRCIRESDKKVKIVIVSAYGDFSYAQRAIRYDVQDFLLKPVSRLMLNQLVDRMREELDKRVLLPEHDWFDNAWTEYIRHLMDEDEAQERKEAEVQPAIVGITFLNQQGRRVQGFKVREAIGALLFNQELCPGLLGCVICAEGDAVIFWDRASFGSEMIAAVDDCLNVSDDLQIYPCTRGDVDIRQWLKRFLQKENYGFYANQNRVYELEENPFTNREIDIEKTSRATGEAIAANCADELMRMVDALFEQAEADRIHPQILKDAVLNFLVQIKFLLKKFEQKESFLMMRNIRLESIHSIHTAAGLKQFLKEKIHTTFQAIDECFYQPGNRIVFRTNAFTELHYSNASFSVQMAADHLGLSKNYFTSLYKEQSGIGFWEYVTKLRMEKAAELLVTTNQMTREAGRAVGYESEYHFSRKFKEYTGESPINYRRSRSK